VEGDAGAALDLALGVARAQERPDRGLQMWLQDVHLVKPPRGQGGESYVLLVRAEASDSPFSMGQFTPAKWSIWVAMDSVVWVAAGAAAWPS